MGCIVVDESLISCTFSMTVRINCFDTFSEKMAFAHITLMDWHIFKQLIKRFNICENFWNSPAILENVHELIFVRFQSIEKKFFNLRIEIITLWHNQIMKSKSHVPFK